VHTLNSLVSRDAWSDACRYLLRANVWREQTRYYDGTMQSCHDLWKAAKAATDAMIQTVYPLIRVELDNPNHGTQYTLTIDSSGDVLAHRRSTGPPFVMEKDGKSTMDSSKTTTRYMAMNLHAHMTTSSKSKIYIHLSYAKLQSGQENFAFQAQLWRRQLNHIASQLRGRGRERVVEH
jgi:hypothetical protein